MCKHPNIVKIIDAFEDYEHISSVLELQNGKDLFDYAKSRLFRISEKRIKDIAF